MAEVVYNEKDSIDIDENVPCCVPFFEKYVDTRPGETKKTFIQKFSTNRWIRLIVYCLVAILCAAPNYNWYKFRQLLYRGGVYACKGEEYLIEGPCERQKTNIKRLLPIASACEYLVGVVAGAALDQLGPRSCGMIGMGVLFLSVVLLMVSSASFEAYPLAMALMGSSVNLIAFPGVLLGDFFPQHKTAAISLILACQVGCSLVAVVLYGVWDAVGDVLTLNHILSGYLLFAWLPCAVLYFFCLPCRRLIHVSVVSSDSDATLPTSDDLRARSKQTSMIPSSDPLHSYAESELVFVEKEPRGKKQCSGDRLAQRGSKNEKILQLKEKLVATKASWSGFYREFLTWDVQIFTVYYVLQLLPFLWYSNDGTEVFGSDITNFAGYLLPVQAICGVILGWAVEILGTLPLCYGVSCLSIATFSFLLIGNHNLQYATVVSHTLASSFIFTSKYTYVDEIYNPDNFGKLVGYIGCTCGFCTFALIPISKINNPNLFSKIFLGLSFFCILLLVILSYRLKLGINHLGDYKKKTDDFPKINPPERRLSDLNDTEFNRDSTLAYQQGTIGHQSNISKHY